MKKLAKKYFIAHKENDGKPHMLRGKAVVVVALVVGVLFFASFLQHTIITGTNFASVISSVLIDLTNNDRDEQGISPLTLNPTLSYAAELKARDMAQKSYFAHTSPEGISPWYWFGEAEYTFLYAGENLAVNFSDSIDVEQAWMDSPTHRQNILSEHFSEIGIATAKGIYKGRETYFVVQLFGTPLPQEFVNSEGPDSVSVEKEIELISEEDIVVLGNTIIFADDTLDSTNDSFIAIDLNGYELPEVSRATIGESGDVSYASVIDTLVTAPRRILFALYAILASFILLPLLSFFKHEIKKHHTRNILYGVALLIFMATTLYASYALIYVKVFV